jgi:glycosyltransferase involved in cell wall biosynthesis
VILFSCAGIPTCYPTVAGAATQAGVSPIRLPTISVVTPSYNQARYLQATLDSVLSQREEIHEYFVLDGGSNDGSQDLIRRNEHRGIDWWVSEPDGGQSNAIHRGFSRATGDILFWINSDDIVLPGAFRAVRAAFACAPRTEVVTGHSIWIDGNGRILKVYRARREERRWVERGIYGVCQQTCFFTRDLYRRVGGLNVDLHCVMDTDLWFRFHQADACWGLVPRFLGGFRKHEESKGMAWVEEYRAEGRYLVDHYPTWYGGVAHPRLGFALHLLEGTMTGRFATNSLMTALYKGRLATEVFPPANQCQQRSNYR